MLGCGICANATAQHVFDKGQLATLNDPWGLYLYNDQVFAWWYDGADWRRGYATLPNTNWTLVTAVITASTDSILIYFNGVSQAVTMSGVGGAPIATSATNMHFGGSPGAGGARCWDGQLSQGRAFNYIRTPAQIRARYHSTKWMFGVPV